MRRVCFFILTVLCLCNFSFGQVDKISEKLYDEAKQELRDGKWGDAHKKLRDACILSENAHLYPLTVKCLVELSFLHNDKRYDKAITKAVIPLLKKAHKLSLQSGDYELESYVLRTWYSMKTEDKTYKHENLRLWDIDCVVAMRDSAKLEWWRNFKEVENSYRIMDLLAEADIAEKRNDIEKAIEILNNALLSSSMSNLRRTVAEIRMRICSLSFSLADGKLQKNTFVLENHLNRVIEFHTERKDNKNKARALYLLSNFRTLKGDKKKANSLLNESFKNALDARDYELQAKILHTLSESESEPKKSQLLKQSQKIEELRYKQIVKDATNSIKRLEIYTTKIVDALKNELRKNPKKSSEIETLLQALGDSSEPKYSEEDKTKFQNAFKKALSAGGETANNALVFAEISERHEALPVIISNIPESDNVYFSSAIESLSTSKDITTLIDLLKHKNSNIVESTAYAIFKNATTDDITRIKEAIAKKPGDIPSLYLNGVLARFGDKDALKFIKEAMKNSNENISANASIVLGSLGFLTPLKNLYTLKESGKIKPVYLGRLLGRAPSTWGPYLIYDLMKDKDAAVRESAYRSAMLRNDSARMYNLENELSPNVLRWMLPRNDSESRLCGTAIVSMLLNDKLKKGDLGAFAEWSETEMDIPETTDNLKDRTDPLSNLVKTELETSPKDKGTSGNTQTVILRDIDDAGNAVVRASITALMGEIVDGTLTLPFSVTHRLEVRGGGIAGVMYRELIVPIDMSGKGLLDTATLSIPGHGKLNAEIEFGMDSVSKENLAYIKRFLPTDWQGDEITTDALNKGTVTLNLKFMDDTASLTFPILIFVPESKDKPDIVAEELIMEPPLPKPDEIVCITLRARNMGKKIEPRGPLFTKFFIDNPQYENNEQVLDLILFDPVGWRPGEYFTFSIQPTFIKNYFMNSYSPYWRPQIGAVSIKGVVDTEQWLDETSRENNSLTITVGLFLPEEEATKVAEEEILARLLEILNKIKSAGTIWEVSSALRDLEELTGRCKVRNAEIDAAIRLIEEVRRMKCSALNVRDAIKRIRSALEQTQPNMDDIRSACEYFAKAERDLINSGVPIDLDTLTLVRNSLQTVGVTTGLAGDYTDLSSVLFDDEKILSDISATLRQVDGILVWSRFARDVATRGRGSAKDFLEGAVDILGQAAPPGLSNLHRALLSAEVDYVDRGFRRSAKALDALGDVIAGEEGAEERLDAAVRSVDEHLSAGLITEENAKNAILGWTKDLPVVGPIVENIVNWTE